MKKRFTVRFVVGLVCMALMVSMLVFSGMTARAEHPSHGHHFLPTGNFYPTGPAVSINDSQHRIPGNHEEKCPCGEVLLKPGHKDEYHSKVYSDLGHVSGTHTHKREAMCGYCNFYAILYYYCPGNPCIDPHD